jgi:hypothetical protein
MAISGGETAGSGEVSATGPALRHAAKANSAAAQHRASRRIGDRDGEWSDVGMAASGGRQVSKALEP